MVSPKPEAYHDGLYHLAAAAESSPSPQPNHYPDAHSFGPYHQQQHQYAPIAAGHRPMHPQQPQYRYSDRMYSPSSASVPSTSSGSAAPPKPTSDDPTLRNPNADAAAAAKDAAAAAAAAEKKISCMECRLSKVKCSGGDLCTRCKRLGKECFYKSHKRGRKSDSSKIQKLERTVDSLSRALEHFSKNKIAVASLSSQSPDAAAVHRIISRAGVADSEDASSPDAYWKAADPARNANLSSSSANAMSPPAHSPRAPRPNAYRDPPVHVHRRPSEVFRQRSTSATFQTPQSIASATPTSDDPDEPENLGLPTLSNPLKLLAQASDSAARDRDSANDPSDRATSSDNNDAASPNDADDAASASGADARDQANTKSASSTGIVAGTAGTHSAADRAGMATGSSSAKRDRPDHAGQPSLFATAFGSATTNTVSRFGPGRGKAFFDMGLFTTKLDNLAHFDPIDRGYLTLAEAQSLYAVFMQYINPALTLLDPHLHTFDYVRSSSALLLSCTCWIAAKYRVEASQIAADLEMHIRSNLLPTILMEGFRNAEIPQALIILAAYHPQMNTLSEDKAWAYVGFAIRIASELDMNSRIATRPMNRQDDAGLARRLRNRERTWLNLWLFETSMSQHMGRRPTLANDPVVMGCAHWHLDKFALPGDRAMVAVVQLRLLMLRNTQLFENFVDVSATHLPAERTAKQVELFRRICASDLDTWLATWTGPSPRISADDAQTSPAGTVASESSTAGSGLAKPDLPPTLSRIQRLKLYYWYARLILDTIALKCSHLGLEVLRPIYKDAYACCMAYLGLFVATMVPNGLFWGHNSTVVTPAYCAIFALRIVGLISTSAGAASLQVKSLPQRESAQAEDLGIDIDAEYTFEMVEKVAKVCEEAGKATPHRRAAAGSYAFFLFTVLAKAKSAWRAKQNKQPERDEGGEGKKRARDDEDKGARQGKNAKLRTGSRERSGKNTGAATGGGRGKGDVKNGDAPGHSGSAAAEAVAHGGVVVAPTQAGQDATSESDHHFLRQLMQFQAGPSGVQTALVSSSTPAHGQHALNAAQQHHAASAFESFTPVSGDVAPEYTAHLHAPHGAMDGAGNGFAPDLNEAMGSAAGMGVEIDWDFGMLDGFLGESLFSDMSFISSSAGANGNTASNT
ncbi:uncharacterized protein PAN0_005c2649 [Moesziomyces antarcticus]|uniref:Uncharacterized protein n=2 Tax=Pseudozyma antarctica TaxID=84753 RepID=A0A081CCN9_PSEA2|nr:uncharacterized protein PAN0_005c2649 [Moesziomyces antarcticus]GAK64435.1 conserved hypothetical protein [Moesziomyces antarcticus]SPO45058.1 uncharacterized protein PSANT_02744 [Moesziomyces antarcticus]